MTPTNTKTEERTKMKNFKKAYEAHLFKLRILFPNESRESLEQMFVVMMRDEKPVILSDSIRQLEEHFNIEFEKID